MDKWDILLQLIELEQKKIKNIIKDNDGHVGQITRAEIRMIEKFKQLMLQSEEAEQNFYETVSGSGG